MKFAIVTEKRFEKNQLFHADIDSNLSPFIYFRELNGVDNTITIDMLESRLDKSDFIILFFLPLVPGTLFDYLRVFYKYPNSKKYLFLFEPKVVAPLGYLRIVQFFFNRVYTWNDSLIDNKMVYKFIWPQSRIGLLSALEFSQKKDIVLMNANKFSLGKHELYSLREKIIRFFETKELSFDLYGPRWDVANLRQKLFGYYRFFPSWRGKAQNKIATLSGYKFNICFENMSDAPGYITEKIWDSFKAQVVPVYFGANNITDYIPANCFIDYRNFSTFEELYDFLCHMDESEYNRYIVAIQEFISSESAEKWFDEKWASNFISSLN